MRHHPKGLQHHGAAEGKAENQSTREQSSTEHCLKFQTESPVAGTEALGSPRPSPLTAQSRAGLHGTVLYTAFGITGLQSLTGSDGVQKVLPLRPPSCCFLSRKPFNAQAAHEMTGGQEESASSGSEPASR